jgi:hypothetical protein
MVLVVVINHLGVDIITGKEIAYPGGIVPASARPAGAICGGTGYGMKQTSGRRLV